MVGAHYDDVELGCGGTAKLLSEKGKKVFKITLTDNEFDDITMEGGGISNALSKKSSEKSCALLGIEEVQIEQAKYGELTYNKSMMKDIEDLILDYSIDSIFFHYHDDMHHDHIVAHEICKTAGRHCKNILCYQSNGYIKHQAFNPNMFINISNFIEEKKAALSFYEEDQPEQNRGGRLFDTVIKQNEIYGYGNGVEYCEGFEVIKLYDFGL